MTTAANSTTQSAYVGCSQESGLNTAANTKNQLTSYNYDSKGDPNNPAVLLRFPTEVEVSTRRWPGTVDMPASHEAGHAGGSTPQPQR